MELFAIELFLRFGIKRLMESDWPLALAVVVVVFVRHVVERRRRRKP